MCRNRTDGKAGSAYSGRLYRVESWRYMGKGTTVREIQAELMARPAKQNKPPIPSGNHTV